MSTVVYNVIRNHSEPAIRRPPMQSTPRATRLSRYDYQRCSLLAARGNEGRLA